tara:strand:+ start:87 stop:1907 length:1821 start_codon:yes stop_codon:yes gene_type:complete
MKIFHILLSLPFIITPFLISSKFVDPSLNIKKISVFIIFSIITFIFIILKRPTNSLNKSAKNLFKFLAVYIIYQIIISFYISTNVSESLWEIFYLIGWVLIYVFIISYIDHKQFQNIIASTAIVGSLLSLLVYNDIYNFISLNIPSSGKLSATFGYKNFFAQYLCFVIPACITSIYIFKHKQMKLLMLALSFINIGALIITRCRAAWLGIFFMFIIFILLNKRNLINDIKKIIYNKKLLSISIVSIFIISFITFKPIDISTGIWIGDKSTIKETLMSIKDINKKSVWGDRIDMYEGSLRMIKNKPFLGVGLGNWKVMYPGYVNNNSYKDFNRHKIILRPHNDILWIATETGIVGFIFLLFFLGYHIKLLLIKYRNNNNQYLLLFCILSLTAIFIESLFDFPKERVIPNLYIWLILGYIVSSTIKTNKYFSKASILPAIIFPVIIFFIFLDLKSQFYSQQIVSMKNNEQYKKMEMNSVISIYYMRNINYLATPTTYYLGLAHYNMGNKDLAHTFFNQALAISPYHIGSLQNKMLMQIEIGKFDKAYDTMLFIEKIYPRLYRARINMIKYCIKANNINLAQTLLKEIDGDITPSIQKEIDQLHNSLYQ